MIGAIKGLRNTCLALCTCDDCAAEVSFAALHGLDSGGMGRASARTLILREPGKVNRHLAEIGWIISAKKHRCPSCEAKRKAATMKKEHPMTTPQNITNLRQPTREQKRQIVELLAEVYDTKAERFKGTDSDVTIADAVGSGCMFGWVAAIRDEMFGPDGGNEEHEKLICDLAQWRANADKLAADMHASLSEFNATRAKVKELSDRVSYVVKAAGPRAKGVA